MTTLLDIVQEACNAVPIAAPPAVVGNTGNETATLCLALANAAGNAVTRRAPGGWVNMIREYDFQTESSGPYDGVVFNLNGFATILLTEEVPDVVENAWIVSGTTLLNNSVVVNVNTSGAPSQYIYQANLSASEDGPTAGKFYFSRSDYPLPDDFQRSIDGTFWDRTRYWQMRGALSPQEWQGFRSSLYGKATIESRWRFRNSDWLSSTAGTPGVNVLSLDPTPQAPSRQMVFEYVSNGWCANASTGARQTQWLADTDYAVVDSYLLTLDLKWRLLRRLGVSYNEELTEYEREADKAVARDGGTMILSLAHTWGIGLVSPYNVQDGFYPSRPS